MSGNFGRQLSRLLRQTLREVIRHSRRKNQPSKGALTTTTLDPAATDAPSPHAAREYRMPGAGLPRLEYAPESDARADPGEVAWAWVPYEDSPARGKDRPVLILSEVTGGFLALQMTSKDHSGDRSHEAGFGRHWLDIGSGPWDSQRRDSEVRLDRLLFIPPEGIRREGATLPKERYIEVVEALQELHG